MITQGIIDNLQSILTTSYQAVSGFSDLEVLGYWPPLNYNPTHDVMIIFEGDESDLRLTNADRGTPSGRTTKYQPDWVNLLYRQRALAQQSNVTMKQAQDRMRTAKTLLRDLFKPDVGNPWATPQTINLNGSCLEAGREIKIHHPNGGPYEANGGTTVVRFSFWAEISILSSVH